MNLKKASIIIFLISSLISCNSNEIKENHAIKMHLDTLEIDNIIDTIRSNPSLIVFEQTDCKQINEKGEKILTKNLNLDTFSIKITSIQDCGIRFGGDFKISNDTLDLIIKQIPQIIKHKNGKIDTIYQSEDCYCFYKFFFKINHIDSVPNIILLNGEKFRGEWKGM